ncbi:hypothetical protein [Shewanella sp.]|uniref:hypothetical protein n=1 Tax=Shewanella sp. TaxID=50422 RepID=UPI0035675237
MNLKPSRLPDKESLKKRAKALAMLDAIICPEWEDRYYSFDQKWDENEQMASMRNGCGDEWFILFASFGIGIKGLDHETEIAADDEFREEIAGQLPASFSSFYKEPSFSWDWVSFCYWLEPETSEWQKVENTASKYEDDNDGSSDLLNILIDNETAYHEFVGWYYELEIPIETIKKIYDLEPLSAVMIETLNKDISINQAIEFANEIGYPLSESLA